MMNKITCPNCKKELTKVLKEYTGYIEDTLIIQYEDELLCLDDEKTYKGNDDVKYFCYNCENELPKNICNILNKYKIEY